MYAIRRYYDLADQHPAAGLASPPQAPDRAIYYQWLLFISHDRAFVRRLATRIIELDRGRLGSWPGDYDDYLRRKAAQLEVEERHQRRHPVDVAGVVDDLAAGVVRNNFV